LDARNNIKHKQKQYKTQTGRRVNGVVFALGTCARHPRGLELSFPGAHTAQEGRLRSHINPDLQRPKFPLPVCHPKTKPEI
jgi:hypothetical protein